MSQPGRAAPKSPITLAPYLKLIISRHQEQDLFFGQIARILETMKWDDISTLRNALWITGSQWAG